MWKHSSGNLRAITTVLAIFAGCALAVNHHQLNGSWRLIPERSEFHGESVIQSGTVTIDDRQGNVYISRNFNYDGANQSIVFTFSTDARERASIKEPGIKSKTQWKGDALEVTTTRDGATTVELYSLRNDGTMALVIDRPNHALETLLFQRQ